MKERGKKISKLAECMKSLPQVLVNVAVKEKKSINKLKVNKNIKDAESQLGKKGRVLVRYSGTQKLCRIMIEGEDKRKILKMANDIAKVMKKEIGV
jgi:phosphoglucosamine mutase